jgi:predicted RNase H-like HicB family nuclease
MTPTPTTSKIYGAVAERSGAWWAVSVPEVRGVHTQGRTWTEALQMTRDAVAVMLDVPVEQVEIDMQVRLPGGDEAILRDVAAARLARDEAAKAEQVTVASAARKLLDAGLSARDTASLLHLSRPRVYQLLDMEANGRRDGSAKKTKSVRKKTSA